MVAKLLALNPGVDSVVLPVNKSALSAFQAEYILGNKRELRRSSTVRNLLPVNAVILWNNCSSDPMLQDWRPARERQ